MNRVMLVPLVAGIAFGVCADVTAAQSRPAPQPTPPAAAAPAVPAPPSGDDVNSDAPTDAGRWSHPVLRIGHDYTLPTGAVVREVRVLFGDATIEGRVDRDVVVVLGTARLSDTAVIDGSLILIGGTVSATSGARLDGDLVIAGGGLEGSPAFSPGGEHVVIGPAALGGRLDTILPWVTRGVLWGRPIVPELPWVWTVVFAFFILYLALGLIFDGPVGAAVTALADKPLTAFLVGLLVLLLAGPLCFLLTLSIIGIAVVPFVLCALVVALILGKIGAARWIGTSILHQDDVESRVQSVRSFVIGSAVICVAYMVPLLGFVAWGTLGVFGLGGSTLAFIAAYRRENPLPPSSVRSDLAPAHQAGPAGEDAAAREHAASSSFDSPVDLVSFPRATFRDRLFAFVLDVILVLIAQELLDLTERDSAIFLFLLIYHVGFWAWKGTTVGGIICQLRLVRVDGAPLRLVDALVRGLSAIFSLLVLGIGALWILRDPERQAWHDKIAGTYVVRVPRNWPL
jgi:hypothetical protein